MPCSTILSTCVIYWKDFIVLCLDVGPSMHDPDNGVPLKTSIKIINQMIQQKVWNMRWLYMLWYDHCIYYRCLLRAKMR